MGISFSMWYDIRVRYGVGTLVPIKHPKELDIRANSTANLALKDSISQSVKGQESATN